MDRITANDAAERHRAFVGLAGALGGVKCDRDRGRDLERARDGEAVVDRAGGVEHRRRTFQEFLGDIVVEARFHNEDAYALEVAWIGGFGSSRLGHSILHPGWQ